MLTIYLFRLGIREVVRGPALLRVCGSAVALKWQIPRVLLNVVTM